MKSYSNFIRERFPSAKTPRDLAERKVFRECFRELSANYSRKIAGENDNGKHLCYL